MCVKIDIYNQMSEIPKITKLLKFNKIHPI